MSTRPTYTKRLVAALVGIAAIAVALAGCDGFDVPAPDLGALVDDAVTGLVDDLTTTAEKAITDTAETSSGALGAQADPDELPVHPHDLVEVVRVVDGDTIVVTRDGIETRVRLMNVQAPEVARGGNAGECGGPEAAAWLTGALPAGTVVGLEHGPQRYDRFDREVAVVITAEGTIINVDLAAAGWATPARFGANDIVYADVTAARDAAQAAGVRVDSEVRRLCAAGGPPVPSSAGWSLAGPPDAGLCG